MTQIALEEIARQLESSDSRDRLLALASLRKFPPADAVPLIEKVLYDEMLPVRSMAIFALGVKPTEKCYPLLTQFLETDPDYGIRAD
ncbi:MAG: HEAT repeat domain-containing protein, partial [Cyanobacteriota bacterium]|nr:HEAT repeat domain-containing protein [Cyanobacteriota bacterium]